MDIAKHGTKLRIEVVIHADQLFAPTGFVGGGSVIATDERGASAYRGIGVGLRNQRQNRLSVGINRYCRGIGNIRTISPWTNIRKIAKTGRIYAPLGI